ncbi:glycosyltransferase family 2 protein [Bradyrhizobium sp. 137]|uniref:glycosyltransferase family 2 protein n=1 Tax=Bradyrhizobium sp. 137 TaxID=2782614 RepID=UPI001FF9BCB2|nr:glycosyltransferase family 2 protein [Bradyrhizobium sp. 137]MCK1757382.1 glycosyltransferase family 2 protein [Bradyrhizobium sp. 137]
MRIAVGYATKGRRDVIALSIIALARQTRSPDHVFFSITSEEDLDRNDLDQVPCPVSVISDQASGLCSQRNRILERCSEFDIVIYFDDDFIMRSDYIESLETIFASDENIQLLTGRVVADGASGPGLSASEAEETLRVSENHSAMIEDVFSAYGCNMAVRMPLVKKQDLRFDEELPLYGWLEDMCFSRMVVLHGRVVRATNLVGVHLGVKKARVSGRKYGYSQIANPLHLKSRGLVSQPLVIRYIARNLAMNIARYAWPEPWIDRRGRFRGNLLALRDLISGKVHPRRILEEI